MSFRRSGIKVPRSVVVGPHIYEVRLVDGLRHDEEDPLLGVCFTDDLLISLDADQPPSVMRETLLHEIVHALAHQWSLGDTSDEEAWASALGVGLLQVFRYNPDLVAWLEN